MQVAQTIIQQLGGKKFLMMTGAKDLVGGPKSLQFGLPKGAKDKINKVRIVLDANDLYTVEFWHINKAYDMQCIKTCEMIYADQLASVFENTTGLRTSL